MLILTWSFQDNEGGQTLTVRNKQAPPLSQNGRFSKKGENHSSWKCQTGAVQSPHTFSTGSGPFWGCKEMTGSLLQPQAEDKFSEQDMGNGWMGQEQCTELTKVTAPQGVTGFLFHKPPICQRHVRSGQTSQIIEGDLLGNKVLQGHRA